VQKNNTLMSDSRAPSCGMRLAELQDLPDHRHGRHSLQWRLAPHPSWSRMPTTTFDPRTGISVFFCTPLQPIRRRCGALLTGIS